MTIAAEPVSSARKPPVWLYSTELARSSVDFWALAASYPMLATLPRGQRHPVLVLPGFMTNDRWTVTLRGLLRTLGYQAHGWRLGRNVGPTAQVLDGLSARLDELHGRYGQPVTLIGWSLGGVFARQLARSHPEQVRQVITLGSPFRLARHDQSWAAPIYSRFEHRHAERLQLPLESDAAPLPVPSTSIYSRIDGIVAWQTCVDRPGEQAENIAVWSSHFGFGHHPAVIWAIADRLAQPAGRWAPFQAPALLRAAFAATDTT
ncbi:alpha/beta hydrolase [Gordonia sp. TBRC 11910]|uniref:Alpha/beta hydrolase n=2 Tax=Gordonia asplenii TaxID=2725283 RepID=A0A848KQD8_9ACTN|nr:alpha/beta hydrolase [Gordonia asplenii]NMO00906.1 alpha/beta hydrolase [Gordonia asplenii]